MACHALSNLLYSTDKTDAALSLLADVGLQYACIMHTETSCLCKLCVRHLQEVYVQPE